MSDNVIILGAGASADAGIPMMESFVDTMWNYATRGRTADKELPEGARKILIDADHIRRDLEPFNSRAFFNNYDLEDILSLLSFEALTGEKRAGDYNTFVKAVALTIELSCRHSYPFGLNAVPIVDS